MFEDIESLMAGKYREVLWLMFRESAKTSFAMGFLLWTLVYRKRRYLNVDSFDKENSERLLFDVVLELQTNDKLRFDFGELYNAVRNQDQVTQKRVSNFVANNGVRVEAHSTQESVRGRKHGDQRPDWLLLDDFETTKTKDSKAYTQQVIGHINEFKAGLDGSAIVLYLGNYISEYGSIQSLIDRAKDDDRLFVRNVPVIIDNKPTWASKYAMTNDEAQKRNEGRGEEDVKVISLEDRKKQLGGQAFAAEMMNQPIDEQSQEFFKTWFRYRTLKEIEEMVTRKFATIDTAYSKAETGDYTGITKNYVDKNNRWNIISQRYKINAKQLIDIIFQLHDSGFEQIGVEETAFTEGLKPFFEEECRKRNKYPYVVALKHGGTLKETRIRGLIPRFEAGDIYFIDNLCYELEEELLRFPKSINDDLMDSLQYQLKIAKPPFEQSEADDTEPEPIYSEIGI